MPRHLYITPGCCPTVKQHKTVFLAYLTLADGDGADMFAGEPQWATRAWRPHEPGDPQIGDDGFACTVAAGFCPHCARPVPPIVRRSTTEKICVVTDGGYYCDTCKERLHGCMCLPPEHKYQPKPAPPPQ